jgi:regulatory protein
MPKSASTTPSADYTGQKLRALAFALLAKREYSKQMLYQKLLAYAADAEEALALVDALAADNYQSDQRMAGMLCRQQLALGRGPRRVQQQLQKHQLEPNLATEQLAEVDWLKQAMAVKIKKFGAARSHDPKQLAKQIRYLQYRGYSMDIIMQVVKTERLEQEP